MAQPPLAGHVNAANVVVAQRVDAITATTVTVLTYASGVRLERLFASVPAPGPPLVGRDRLLADVRTQLLSGGSLPRVALHGLPGAGKSALALALAYDESAQARFSGGVLWAGLGPNADVESILSRWAAALGVDIAAAPSAIKRAELLNSHLQSALGGKPFLLVLDDAWRWEDVVPFLRLTAPDSALLLTTRDERVASNFVEAEPLAVPELPENEAVEVLARACPMVLDVDPEGLREIARAGGGSRSRWSSSGPN
jgi:hypothetical protein